MPGHGRRCPREEADGVVAEVLWVDRFGNCQLNVGPDELADWASTCGRSSIGDDGACGHAGDARSPSSAPARSGWWSTRTACWRWCSTSARPPRSSASRPATQSCSPSSTTTAAPSAGGVTVTGHAAPRPVACAAMRPATTLTLGLLLVAILVAGVISLLRL